MTNAQQANYVHLIQENEGIIHKVISLYVDHPEDKKDLYQEILLQAWKSFPRFSGKAAFSTWLYRICLNTVFTFKKKEQPTTLTTEVVPEQATPDTNEQAEILYLLIRRLDEVDRMIMTLHLDGYKNPEIAEITGMTTNHINVKIHRLKTQIIAQFRKIEEGR